MLGNSSLEIALSPAPGCSAPSRPPGKGQWLQAPPEAVAGPEGRWRVGAEGGSRAWSLLRGSRARGLVLGPLEAALGWREQARSPGGTGELLWERTWTGQMCPCPVQPGSLPVCSGRAQGCLLPACLMLRLYHVAREWPSPSALESRGPPPTTVSLPRLSPGMPCTLPLSPGCAPIPALGRSHPSCHRHQPGSPPRCLRIFPILPAACRSAHGLRACSAQLGRELAPLRCVAGRGSVPGVFPRPLPV